MYILSPNPELLALFCISFLGYIYSSHKHNIWQHTKIYERFSQVIEDKQNKKK